MDTRLLRESFALLAPRADELAEHFYATAFYYGGEEVRNMFPVGMSAQRDRLLAALIRIVTDVDDLERLSTFLAGLGRDHRKFDVQPAHYDLIGKALLATLSNFAGDAWTPEVHETWAGAYALIAQVMQQGAETDKDSPPWWDAVVTSREMRGPDVAVIRARLSQPMPYLPGQSAAVQFPEQLPRVWRFYSPANMASPSGTVIFHVKADGMLSTALALHAKPGSLLRVGPPVGNLKLDLASKRPVLLVAGSTGLAPLEAILEEIAARTAPPPTALFFGAETPADLYDLPLLDKLAAQRDWLTVTYAVTSDATPDYSGEHGTVVDVAAGAGDWTGHDAYACGSTPMVRATVDQLTALGVPADRIHVEDFGWER